jgi:hypothetical protein
MAKAGDNSIPSPAVWLPLDQAFKRLVGRVRSPAAAEVRIRRILEAGQWRGESFDGAETFDGKSINGDIWSWATLDVENCAATFESEDGPINGGTNLQAGTITWVDPDYDERTGEVRPAQYMTAIALRAMDGIACIEILLPIDGADHAADSNKRWIYNEVERRKTAGNIPQGITEFSKQLETALAKAAQTNKGLRPIIARTIENELREWKIWPIKPPK